MCLILLPAAPTTHPKFCPQNYMQCCFSYDSLSGMNFKAILDTLLGEAFTISLIALLWCICSQKLYFVNKAFRCGLTPEYSSPATKSWIFLVYYTLLVTSLRSQWVNVVFIAESENLNPSDSTNPDLLKVLPKKCHQQCKRPQAFAASFSSWLCSPVLQHSKTKVSTSIHMQYH